MSKLLITKYHNQLHEILSAGGVRNEGAITFAFANLLRSYAEKKNLLLVEQKSMVGRTGKTIRPDVKRIQTARGAKRKEKSKVSSDFRASPLLERRFKSVLIFVRSRPSGTGCFDSFKFSRQSLFGIASVTL